MDGKIVLISDDKNFFEYLMPKLIIRKSDELFRFSFDELTEKFHQLTSSLLIINSENKQEQTLELLSITKDSISVVFGFNDDEEFKIKGYRAGMFSYISLSSSDEAIQAALLPALKMIASINKNNFYRDILVKNSLITLNNEVLLDSNWLIENELNKIHANNVEAVLGAISPDDKSRFNIQAHQIETIILNNIRSNDLLINFATNKYFLLLYNINVENAYKLWNKIAQNFSESMYVGFTNIGKKNRQQVINEALNKLHESINRGFKSSLTADVFMGNNFKLYKEEFKNKLDKIINPVFYHMQQKYNNRLFNITINLIQNNAQCIFNIASENESGSLSISTPGYSAVNIDIKYECSDNNQKNKRISIEPDELEAGLLEDLLEQFILEFKDNNEESYDHIE